MAANGTPSPTSSAFLSHLTSYPVVSDGIDYFKSSPIGQKSIAVTHSAYDQIVKPLSPYIAKANSIASPYVSKVDNLADSGLSKIDSSFPIVKESTGTIKEKVTDTVGYPRKRAGEVVAYGKGFAGEQKDYLLKVYSDEYSKTGQKGLVPAAKAGVTTSVLLTAQLVSWLADFLVAKKDQTKDKAGEATDVVKGKAGEAKDVASEKVDEAKEVVDEKTS